MSGKTLPILLIGGAAALMLAGGKKKKKGELPDFGDLELPPTVPPPLSPQVKKSGSGYPGITRKRMQEIQTMLVANGYDPGKPDGKYGPKTERAIWEFQEDWGGLQVDGKPGPKTQAALEEAEAQRISALPYAEGDECDPMDRSTWGDGNICVFDGKRWRKISTTAGIS